MAHIIPSDVSRLSLSGLHGPELDTLMRLKSGLPDSYTVFHGVHWSRDQGAGAYFGEIDFVVLNLSGSVLLIEQKNGRLEEAPGDLVKHYREGHQRGAVEQLHDSLNAVRGKFQWKYGRKAPLPIDCLVYCPDHRVVDLNAVGIDGSRVVDAPDAGELIPRIEQILGPGVDLRDGSFERVRDFFCQTFEVVPDIHAHVSAQEKAYVRQARGLATALAGLRMNPFRLRVQAAAGSGKSMVARDFYARAEEAGRRVLLVCFNRPLADRLKSQLEGQGYVNTWYGLCDAFLKSRGQRLDFGDMSSTPDFWERIAEQVTAEVIPDEWLFDALVVDEGQDFEQEWFDILQIFLKENADILWLEDPVQNLRDGGAVVTPGFVGYESRDNYRSPESIAAFIRAALPFEFEPRNTLPGLGVGRHTYESPEEQHRRVAHLVRQLLKNGFSQEDIVILTCRGLEKSGFKGTTQIGDIQVSQFTGEYDSAGDQIYTPGRLRFETVRRFKGQEAPAVILVDVDPSPEKLERDLRLLYCGMTRATVRLELMLKADNPENDRFQEG